MSVIVNAGEVAAAAADAYGATQSEGGLSSAKNQASFGAAVASAAATWASVISSPGSSNSASKLPFLFGVATGLAPAASATQLALNLSSLMDRQATPGEKLAASLGILGGATGTLAGLIPPAAMLTPQGAALKTALTAISITATAAQLGVQGNLSNVNDLISDSVAQWNSMWLSSDALASQEATMAGIQQKTQIASAYASPIILDLNGDGVVGTVGLDAGVYFDHAADGFAERTGWLAPGDGLLVWDRNANGAIDSGRELLGSESLLPNGLKAVNGFDALKALDANGDGVINASDPAFAQLRVWVDADSQGRTGPGELLTLEQAGVLSMGVAYANSAYVDAQGNAFMPVRLSPPPLTNTYL